MTGPEHYQEAERLIKATENQLDAVNESVKLGELSTNPEVMTMFAMVDITVKLAQVHATLSAGTLR